MKLDRQQRGQRLPTVPETTSLLGKPGGDATSPRSFAVQSAPQPRRLLPYAAACMALGLLALYFLGVNDGSWHAAHDAAPYWLCTQLHAVAIQHAAMQVLMQ